VKRLFKLALAPALALALCVVPLAAALAQMAKPIAVVSLASLNEDLSDIAYVTRTAGMPDYGDTARFFVGGMAAGIDKQRPIGAYVVPQGNDFLRVLFVPVEPNGLATIFKLHRDTLGQPKDAGNGVQEVGINRSVFVKEQNGWAFVAMEKESLASLPQDPAALLGDLPKKYNIAAKLMIQNVPAEIRRTVIDQLKIGTERFLNSPAARQQNIDREQAQQLTSAYFGSLDRLMTEGDEAFIGLGIDEPSKKVVLDLGFSAKKGTSLARSMKLQSEAKSNFTGFVQPKAAATMTLASKLGPEDIKQAQDGLKAARGQWVKQLDDSPEVPADKREVAKSALNQLIDIIQGTIATGKMDGGATLILLPKSISFAFGGFVADGAAVDRLLKTIADLGQGIPNFPELKLNVGSIGELKLNRLIGPLPPGADDARELLGENIDIIIGVAPKAVIVAGGKDSEGLLHQVLDKSKQAGEQAVSPFRLVVSLLPIMKFSQSVKDSPPAAAMIASLEQSGNDQIVVVSEAKSTSTTTHVEVQEGVIKAIGEGVKRAGARFDRR